MNIKRLIAAFAALFITGAAAAQTAPSPFAPPPLEPENTLLLDLSTGGRVTVQLRPDVAPAHVERVKTLARKGFYDGLAFHRVIDGFMAQGGDPRGDGTGGSDLPDLKAEFNGLPHVRGAFAAARAEADDSANSQFFIMLAPRLSLDGKYTVYGRVVSGMNFVDMIEKGEPPANPSRILQASIAADNKAPPAAGAGTAVSNGAARSFISPVGTAAGPAVPPPPSFRLPEPAAARPKKKN